MSGSGDKGQQCFECSKHISGKKSIECNDCGEFFCKEHIKVNDSDHSAICKNCFRQKINLEVTLEMQNQTLDAKNQLSALKEKLKTCKKDLSNKKAAIERHQNQVKINEKSYIRKFESLNKKIEEESQRNENIENTIKSLTATLDESKEGEKTVEERLAGLESEYTDVQTELDTLKQENNGLKADVKIASEKSEKLIAYTRLRNSLCNSCKNRIKSVFKEEILNGNPERESLIASVLAVKERMSQRKSTMEQSDNKVEKKPEACCAVF